jgi:Rrf2 family protein
MLILIIPKAATFGSFTSIFGSMLLSKSFGYALRGVLYIAMPQNNTGRVQVDEIAGKLNIPKDYFGKMMKQMAAEVIINSTKGPYGGFAVNEVTLGTNLMTVAGITEGNDFFSSCVLQFKRCNATHPCPLHKDFEQVRQFLNGKLTNSTIADLLHADVADFIKSLSGLR